MSATSEVVIYWTISLIKQRLPDVTVLLNGEIIPAKLSGRKEQFATVTPLTGRDQLDPLFPVGSEQSERTYLESACDHKFSWEAVKRCLNKGTPLRI